MPSGTEESTVNVASCLSEGEAPHWWVQLRRGPHLPPYITSVQASVQRLTDRPLPRSAGEKAVGALRKLKQVKISIEGYIEKYYSLMGKSCTVDPVLLYQWLVTGFFPGERQSVTGWAAEKELRGEPFRSNQP